MRGFGSLAHEDPVEQPEPEPLGIVEFFDACLPYFGGEGDDAAEVNPATWLAWRVFLAAAFGEPCPEDGIYSGVPEGCEIPRGAAALTDGATPLDIYRACTRRDTWPDHPFREVALVVGRRGGKSFVSAVIAAYLSTQKKYKLGLGQRGMVQIIARDKDQARNIREYYIAMLDTIPILKPFKTKETGSIIELSNKLAVEVRAASFKGVRGYTVVAALLDEIAFWMNDETSKNPDTAVLRALRPAMSRVKGSMLVQLSSPYARKGVLFETYSKHYGVDNARVLVWQADSLSMNPEPDPEILAEISEQYEDDPDSAQAEYGAMFREDVTSPFSPEAIKAVTETGCFERPRSGKASHRAFVDPSGGSSDSMTLAIAHTDRETGREVLDCVREVRPPFNTESVTEEFAKTIKSYGLSSASGDAYSGAWVKDAFSRYGVRYEHSKLNRSQIYLELLPMVNSGQVELLDHRKMRQQFEALERKTGRGRDIIDHPPGGHDDVANAAAGALVVPETGADLRVRRISGAEADAPGGKKTAAQRLRESMAVALRGLR